MPRMSWCSILGGLAQNLFLIMASGLAEECQKLRVYSQSVGIVRKHSIKESNWPFIGVKKSISRTLSNYLHHSMPLSLISIYSMIPPPSKAKRYFQNQRHADADIYCKSHHYPLRSSTLHSATDTKDLISSETSCTISTIYLGGRNHSCSD